MIWWMLICLWLSRLILVGLLILSLWSWALIFERKKIYQNIGTSFKQLSRFQLKKQLEKSLLVLGTLGSTTPFVGLFGTILGIIVAFGELSQGNIDMLGIMMSLAEALILTAAGLFVAIPATVSFNIFSKKSKMLLEEYDEGR
jgi:biopolymer transport protein ExbB/TolQ